MMTIHVHYMKSQECEIARGENCVTAEMRPYDVIIITTRGKQYQALLAPVVGGNDEVYCVVFFMGETDIKALDRELYNWSHVPLATHYMYTRGLFHDLKEGISHDGRIMVQTLYEREDGYHEVTFAEAERDE